MPRPRLEAPHVCSTTGCGAKFIRNGKVKPKPLCPRCYTRERRGSKESAAPALPAVRIHATLPVDVYQRAGVYLGALNEGAGLTLSDLISRSVVAFLDRAEAESARRTAQGNHR